MSIIVLICTGERITRTGGMLKSAELNQKGDIAFFKGKEE